MLDRIIMVAARVETVTVLTYSLEQNQFSHVNVDGTWNAAFGNLYIALQDDDGVATPDRVDVGAAITAQVGSDAPVTGVVEGYFSTFSHRTIDWTGSIVETPFPTVTTPRVLQVTIVGTGVPAEPSPAWARRYDFVARDSLSGAEISTRSRYIVRAEGIAGSLLIGDTFTDEEGRTVEIQNKASILERRYFEYLVEREGSE